MIERWKRFIIWLAMAAFSVGLLCKGHGVSPGGDAVSFLGENRAVSSWVTVRLGGKLETPGIYRVRGGAVAEDVIIMTLFGVAANHHGPHHDSLPLRSGEIIEVFEKKDKSIGIIRKEMSAEEKLLLGIPLELNRMTQADWEYLPGIGEGIAKKLVQYRQINGDFASLNDLKRVPGIGDARLRQIEGFFHAQ